VNAPGRNYCLSINNLLPMIGPDDAAGDTKPLVDSAGNVLTPDQKRDYDALRRRTLHGKLKQLVDLEAYFDLDRDVNMLDLLIERCEWRKQFQVPWPKAQYPSDRRNK